MYHTIGICPSCHKGTLHRCSYYDSPKNQVECGSCGFIGFIHKTTLYHSNCLIGNGTGYSLSNIYSSEGD